MQEEIIKKIQSENKQLENKLKCVIPVEKKPTQILIQRDTTNLIRENKVEKIPYRHPNHSSRYLKNRKQSTKIIDTRALHSQDVSSLTQCNVQQRINLGWIDPTTYQKLCSTLRSLYRLVSSTKTLHRTMRSHYKALRTNPF